jgi:hypothetical protein
VIAGEIVQIVNVTEKNVENGVVRKEKGQALKKTL